jgi:hypothetical protein
MKFNSQKYYKNYLVFFLLIAGAVIAFAQIEITPLVTKKLQLKTEEYKKKKLAECKQNAILEAEIYIDSILYRSMNSPMQDSVSIPIKPLAPMDSIQMDIDTNAVRPLLENNLKNIQ